MKNTSINHGFSPSIWGNFFPRTTRIITDSTLRRHIIRIRNVSFTERREMELRLLERNAKDLTKWLVYSSGELTKSTTAKKRSNLNCRWEGVWSIELHLFIMTTYIHVNQILYSCISELSSIYRVESELLLLRQKDHIHSRSKIDRCFGRGRDTVVLKSRCETKEEFHSCKTYIRSMNTVFIISTIDNLLQHIVFFPMRMEQFYQQLPYSMSSHQKEDIFLDGIPLDSQRLDHMP